MFWMLMLDFALAMSFWLGFDLDRPIADVPSHCCANACECPKGTACPKTCAKDDCCCKRGACEVDVCCPPCCPPDGCPVAFGPQVSGSQLYCPQVCNQPAVCPPTAYPSPPCQMPAPAACEHGFRSCVVGFPLPAPALPQTTSVQGFAFPYSLTAPQMYVVEMKLGHDCAPKMMLPVGHASTLEVGSPAHGPYRRFNLHLHPAQAGCVKVDVRLDETQGASCYGPVKSAYRGSKEVRLDTVSNVVLSGTGPEPRNVQVLVKSVNNAQPMMPAPLGCPVPPPMPPRAAFIPPPMPIQPPQVCLPEPMPLPMPRPVMPQVTPAVPVSYATVTHTAPTYGTRFEHVRCCHEAKVCMKNGDTSVMFTKMTLERRDCGSLTVSAGAKYAHVRGKQWKAQADCIDVRPDGCIILSGHVKLDSESIGQGASVKADKLCVLVREGKLVKIVSQDTFAPER